MIIHINGSNQLQAFRQRHLIFFCGYFLQDLNIYIYILYTSNAQTMFVLGLFT